MSAAPAQGSADDAYSAFAQQYFARSFARDPIDATSTGVHSYDRLTNDLSAAAFARYNAEDHANLRTLLGIEQQNLSPRTRMDAKALELQIRDNLLQNETMALWRHRPDNYVGEASYGVFALINRDFAPLTTRMRDVIARENAVPLLFARARANLTTVDAASALIGRDDALGLASFFGSDVPKAFASVKDARLQRDFQASTRRASAAATHYAAWLGTKITHPTGSYAIGATNYVAMLRYEDGIDLSLSEYLSLGERALEVNHARIVAVAHLIDPHKTVPQVIADVARRHPSGAQLLAASARDLVRLRRFITKHDIIALPPEANVAVRETPPFARSTVTAQEDSPGPLETVATRGYYFVTPPDPHDPPRIQEAYLETFNDFERPIVGAHEVYPGHFTNFMLDRHLSLTLTEKLVSSNSFSEGWAHYCEQMIVDEGWGNGDPRVRLMQLREALLRNVRYVAGVKLHTQGMTVAQAQRLFEDEGFQDPADARAEAKRGTQDPIYGYYTLGKMEILKLRGDYKKKMGEQFTLAGFHAALLQYGDFPISLVRPLILGANDDGKLL
ncbi:MAG TPA: DUF885 domain-containing protein [Candidatus Baltobacteraceae bacterium]